MAENGPFGKKFMRVLFLRSLSQEMRHINIFLGAQSRCLGGRPKNWYWKSWCAFFCPLNNRDWMLRQVLESPYFRHLPNITRRLSETTFCSDRFSFYTLVLLNALKNKETTTSFEGTAMREFCPRKQGVSRGLRPSRLILNKGAITSLSLIKPFSSNRAPLSRKWGSSMRSRWDRCRLVQPLSKKVLYWRS